jgi:hypothetical protein
VTRSQADNWSIRRSLAFLAATFAITFGSLMPFAALAASTPDHPVFCSADGLQTIAVDQTGRPLPGKGMMGIKCAACLLALSVALPQPPLVTPAAAPTTRPASVFIAEAPRLTPPARAPPRPPSTAPPHA